VTYLTFFSLPQVGGDFGASSCDAFDYFFLDSAFPHGVGEFPHRFRMADEK
jgi:hypothetical protein